MKIVIAGGSGFLSLAIARRLSPRGEIVILSRDPSRVEIGRGIEWNPPQSGKWEEDVASADVVINAAGANVGERRWTEERKRLIVSSRLDSTAALAAAIRNGERAGRLFISFSGVGYYGPRGDEIVNEADEPGSDFFGRLGRDWEARALEASDAARLVILRLGVVFASNGGALEQMARPFRFFAGGVLGSGRQWLSWIDIEDLLAMIDWIIDHPVVEGIYNATAPEPITNRDFTRELARALHRPAIFRVPSFALTIILGEMADALLLQGQRVVPKRALDEGFKFQHRQVADSLHKRLGRAKRVGT